MEEVNKFLTKNITVLIITAMVGFLCAVSIMEMRNCNDWSCMVIEWFFLIPFAVVFLYIIISGFVGISKWLVNFIKKLF